MLRGSLDWTWGTKGQFIRPRCIVAVRSRTFDILIRPCERNYNRSQKFAILLLLLLLVLLGLQRERI